MYKSVYVAYDASDAARAALRYGCWLASLLAGKVYVGHVVTPSISSALNPDLMAGPLEYAAIVPPTQSPEQVEAERRQREEQAIGLLAEAQDICQRWPVPCQTRCSSGVLEEEILEQSRGIDLVAMGRGGADLPEGHLSRLLEEIIRQAPQPVLATPAKYGPPAGMILLYNGGERALHALNPGAEIARRMGMAVRLLTAAVSHEEGQRICEPARRYLEDHEVAFEAEVIETREAAARILLERVAREPSALVVMGAFGEPRLLEWLAGSTTRAILREAPNPLLLCTHP